MRVYLAIAVLMLAFLAYTEAQEQTIEDKLTAVRDQALETGRNLADKFSALWEEFKGSEQVERARAWGQGFLQNFQN